VTLIGTLIEKASDYLPADKVEVVANAFHFAEKAHEGQKRLSGEPFVKHPLHTALFLADLRLDSNALAAALLHDVMEDCDVAYDELADRFGGEVATLVDGVTKLTKTELLPDVTARRTQSGSGDDLARGDGPQDADVHGRGHPRRADKAGRPPPQHADAVPGQASRRGMGPGRPAQRHHGGRVRRKGQHRLMRIGRGRRRRHSLADRIRNTVSTSSTACA